MILAAWLPLTGSPLGRQFFLACWGTGTTLFLERRLYGHTVREAGRFVGLQRAHATAVGASLLCSIPMWAFLPLVSLTNGITIAVRPEWPSILLGVVLVNGITEEVVHRGFVFHHFREEWAFMRAAAWAAAFFAVQHLYLILSIGWIPGLASVILALLISFPMAHAFESGGKSIVAPAILHISANAPMLILVSTDGAFTAMLVPYMGVVLLSAHGVFATRLSSAGTGRLRASPECLHDKGRIARTRVDGSERNGAS